MGSLFVVATPIGNLADISKRAIETLENVDIILYPIIRRFGDYSEQVFRKRKFSMTRYI